MVIIHVTACGWLAIKFDPPLANPEGEYIIATYWSVTTLTTVGYGDITPKTPTEMQFAAMVMLLGFVLMGYLIGNISGLLNRSDPLRAQYAAALEEVSAFATYNGLPADLQHRIVDYFGYMWQQRAAFNESSVLDALPAGIRTEIMLHLKRDVIQEVPFFREASERFIREIANEMRPVVVTPGEHVFHAGDPALHMFFVSRGSLEVIDEAGKPLGHLGEGDFFGEMALLQGRRRMAGVRALDYCDLYKLELHAFERILEAHPGFRDYMKRVATERAELAGVVIDQGDIR
jgi:voltage-gated potassium channel